MASPELQRLWRLAQVDRQLVDIRARAANLDVGQRAQAALDKLDPEYQEAKTNLRTAEQQVTDLELKQKGDEQKINRIQQDLYGGKIVNPREVTNLEKELEMLKRRRDEDSEKLLELYDTLPDLNKKFEAVAVKHDALIKERDERRRAAVAEKVQIEAAFKEASAKRPEAVKGISPTLLARYDNIRQHHGGIGMVQLIRKTGNCGGCGTHLPTRTVVTLQEDKVAVCEDCHRILYYTEGVV